MPFHRRVFEHLAPAEREEHARKLGALLSQRIREAADFDIEVDKIIAELRSQGHDLWNFDWDDDFQLWCPNYSEGRGVSGLTIDFRRTGDVEVTWSDVAPS